MEVRPCVFKSHSRPLSYSFSDFLSSLGPSRHLFSIRNDIWDGFDGAQDANPIDHCDPQKQLGTSLERGQGKMRAVHDLSRFESWLAQDHM